MLLHKPRQDAVRMGEQGLGPGKGSASSVNDMQARPQGGSTRVPPGLGRGCLGRGESQWHSVEL